MTTSEARIRLTADDKASAKIAGLRDRLTDAGKGVANLRSAVAFLGPALAGLNVIAFTRLIKGSIDSADAAIKQARSVGVLTEEITALNFAAELSGVSQDELTAGLQRLARTAKSAGDGVKSSADAFAQLGISVKGSDGQLKGTSELLEEVAEAFAALPDGIRKTAAAQEIFGRSGARLISLLNGGRQGLQAFRDEAQKLGLVIGTDTAVAAEQLNDNIERLRKNFTGLSNDLARAVLPQVNEFVARILAARETFEGFGQFISASLGRGNAFTDASQGVVFFTQKLEDLRATRAQLERESNGKPIRRLVAVKEEIDEAQRLLDFYQRTLSILGQTGPGGGRGSINPAFAVQPPKPPPDPGKAGKPAEIGFAITDPANEQLQNFLRSEKEAYAEIDAYIRSALERAQEFGTAITDPVEQIKVDFLRSEKAAYEQTDADVAALLANIGKLDERTQQFLTNVQDAFGDTLLRSFKGDFDNIFDLWSDLLLRMVAEAAAADLVSSLFGQGQGGNLANLGNIFLGLFGGGRAGGGPVRPGKFYEVNERGAPGELFEADGKQYLMPSRSGRVTPTSQGSAPMSAGGGVFSPVTHVHIDARTDQAQVAQVAAAAIRQAQEGMWQQLRARGLA